MRRVKTLDTEVCEICVDSTNKWDQIELRQHVDYSGG